MFSTVRGSALWIAALLSVLGFAKPVLAAVASTTWTATVTAVSASTAPATVLIQAGEDSYAVRISLNTKIVRGPRAASDVSELALGDRVKVTGTLKKGGIAATRIVDLTATAPGTLRGRVTAIDPAGTFISIRVNGKTLRVRVREKTIYVLGSRSASLGFVRVGDVVRVFGAGTAQALKTAQRVVIELKTIRGTVATHNCGTNQTTIAVSSGTTTKIWTVVLTPETVYRTSDLSFMNCREINVFERVVVQGKRGQGTTILAASLQSENAKRTPLLVSGVVRGLNPSLGIVVIGGDGISAPETDTIIVVLTPETPIIDLRGGRMAVASLNDGRPVQIIGTQTGLAITARLVVFPPTAPVAT